MRSRIALALVAVLAACVDAAFGKQPNLRGLPPTLHAVRRARMRAIARAIAYAYITAPSAAVHANAASRVVPCLPVSNAHFIVVSYTAPYTTTTSTTGKFIFCTHRLAKYRARDRLVVS